MYNLHEFKNPDEAIGKNSNYWTTRGLPDKPGIYIYAGVTGAILYIGKAQQLPTRLAHHFKHDQKLELVEGTGVLEWTYQNEFPNRGTRIFYFVTDMEELTNIEASLIQAHVLMHRARPLHNSSMSKAKLSPSTLEQAKSILKELQTQFYSHE